MLPSAPTSDLPWIVGIDLLIVIGDVLKDRLTSLDKVGANHSDEVVRTHQELIHFVAVILTKE